MFPEEQLLENFIVTVGSVEWNEGFIVLVLAKDEKDLDDVIVDLIISGKQVQESSVTTIRDKDGPTTSKIKIKGVVHEYVIGYAVFDIKYFQISDGNDISLVLSKGDIKRSPVKIRI